MNVDDGRLLAMADPDLMQQLTKDRSWLPVPDEMDAAVQREFARAGISHQSGQAVTVDLRGETPLARWAALKRAERDKKKAASQKKRRKRKAAKRARARNRR